MAVPGPRGGGGQIGRGVTPGGGNFAGRGGRQWQGGPKWQGGRQAHRHFRGGPVYGFGGYGWDYGWPDYYGYWDEGCWQLRFIRGAYRRVWVCY